MNFFHTHISPKAIQLAVETLQSGMLSEGKRVAEFEAALSEKLGLVNPVAVNSGTSALHLALAVAGVGPGDEVILPAQTFVATGLVILMQGATPVFADINPRTGNLSPESFEARITPKTRAVMPVHWAGYPCDLAEINAIADKHGIAVVEDAAHALGATYRGKPIGAVSRFTAFSFQAVKHLTTGDGGALCCLRDEDYQAAKRRRWFGIDRANAKPSILGERVYDLTELGYKYHMNDLAAAIGLGNLEDFPERLEKRRAIAGRFREAFSTCAGIELLEENSDRKHAYWLFTIRTKQRAQLIERLIGRGLPASVVHLGIDRYSILATNEKKLPVQESFNLDQIALPVHEGLTEQDVQVIIRAVQGLDK